MISLGAALVLGGCQSSSSGAAPASAAPSTTATVVTPSTTTSSIPDYATDKQIASVVAGEEKLWRDAADKAGECRFKYVEKGGGTLGEMERMTCYTNEVTASMSAQTAIRDLSQLRIPPSMEDLVAETMNSLQMLVDSRLEEACGPAMNEPKDTKKCDEAMGAQMWGYHSVTGVLDKWAPYF